MRAEVLKDLLALLDCVDADPAAKAEFRKLILAVGTEHGISGFERENRVSYARNLLDHGTERPAIRDRLVAQFSISESQAYRDIAAALQFVPKHD